MNTTQPEVPLERDDRNDTVARRDTLEDKIEKYRSLEELEKLFLEAKRHHSTAPLPAHR
jgi:hypothetical protein